MRPVGAREIDRSEVLWDFLWCVRACMRYQDAFPRKQGEVLRTVWQQMPRARAARASQRAAWVWVFSVREARWRASMCGARPDGGGVSRGRDAEVAGVTRTSQQTAIHEGEVNDQTS